MFPELEIILFLFLLVTAIVSLNVKNLLTAVVCLSLFSFISALLYLIMGAVDVAFTEAVVGAGITGVFFILLILKTTRRTLD